MDRVLSLQRRPKTMSTSKRLTRQRSQHFFNMLNGVSPRVPKHVKPETYSNFELYNYEIPRKKTILLSESGTSLKNDELAQIRLIEKERKGWVERNEYSEARRCYECIKGIVEGKRKEMVGRERERQNDEVKRFELIYSELLEKKFLNKIDVMMEKHKKKWERMKRNVLEKFKVEKMRFNNADGRKYCKKSHLGKNKLINELKNSEMNLANNCHMYEFCKVIKKRRKIIEDKEKIKNNYKFRKAKRKKIKRLRNKQLFEMEVFKQKKQYADELFRVKIDRMKFLFFQKKKNLLNDMKHSHKLQFINSNTKRSRLSKTRYQKKRKRIDSNYYGTILWKSNIGSSGKGYSIPSLVDLYLDH